MKACEQSKEPIFGKLGDRNGNVYWEGYDPVSNRTFYCASENEARIWLARLPYFR